MNPNWNDWRTEWRLVNGDCQVLLADRMRQLVEERASTDAPFRFVVNVGDNFYPAGVTGIDDPVRGSCTCMPYCTYT